MMRFAMTAPAVGSYSWLLQVIGPHIYCPTLHLGIILFPLIPAHLPHHLTKPNPYINLKQKCVSLSRSPSLSSLALPTLTDSTLVRVRDVTLYNLVP